MFRIVCIYFFNISTPKRILIRSIILLIGVSWFYYYLLHINILNCNFNIIIMRYFVFKILFLLKAYTIKKKVFDQLIKC